ncbi:MAG: DnaB-like helicase C-terminal domain-containing protein, partial [Bacteroidales bacterium]
MKHFNFSENDFSLNSIPSGFTELDKITGGWQRGNLIMIAAPFRMGKTAFALSMLRNNFLLENSSVIWFSTFLSKNQFIRMFISNYAEIQIEEITIGKVDEKLINEINELFKYNDFYFYDNPNLNVKKINQILAAFNTDNLPDFILIDNLNYFEQNSSEQKTEVNHTNMKLIELKAIARRFNIPVLVLYDCNFPDSKTSEFCTQFVKLNFSRYLIDTLCYIYRPEYFKIVEN